VTVPLFDYTRLPYEPVGTGAGGPSSSFVLDLAIDAVGGDVLRAPLEALRVALGDDATVWGLKLGPCGYSWELYFYDYSRIDPRFRVDRVLAVIGDVAPPLALSVPVDPRRHFMFSVDVASTAPRPVHLYFYDVGERMTGLSYGADPSDGWTLENHYSFYEPATEAALLREKVVDSPNVSAAVPVERILVPELVDCRRVCVANKPTCDGVYFSGVPLSQFAGFLRSFDYDQELVSSVARHEPELDHILYDVAFDYRSDASGELEILKSAFYGTV